MSSGTVAAALEAVWFGYRAVSLSFSYPAGGWVSPGDVSFSLHLHPTRPPFVSGFFLDKKKSLTHFACLGLCVKEKSEEQTKRACAVAVAVIRRLLAAWPASTKIMNINIPLPLPDPGSSASTLTQDQDRSAEANGGGADGDLHRKLSSADPDAATSPDAPEVDRRNPQKSARLLSTPAGGVEGKESSEPLLQKVLPDVEVYSCHILSEHYGPLYSHRETPDQVRKTPTAEHRSESWSAGGLEHIPLDQDMKFGFQVLIKNGWSLFSLWATSV